MHGARLALFAADHGISKAVPAVSAYPRSVTPAMFGAIARGQAASSVLAAANGCRVVLTDVGVDGDVTNITGSHLPTTVLHKKVSSRISVPNWARSWQPDMLCRAVQYTLSYVGYKRLGNPANTTDSVAWCQTQSARHWLCLMPTLAAAAACSFRCVLALRPFTKVQQ